MRIQYDPHDLVNVPDRLGGVPCLNGPVHKRKQFRRGSATVIGCQADFIRDKLVDEFLADKFAGGGMRHHFVDDADGIPDAIDTTLVCADPVLMFRALEKGF